ncbi:type IV pilus biogenesis protein PilI [Pseudomonas frederiksbergensis]
MTSIARKIEIISRSIRGEKNTTSAADLASAMKISKQLRTTENHMVCVVENGIRTLRWDRTVVINQNRWRKVSPDKVEVLGAVREVSVTYVTEEEIQARKDQWLAECWPDNRAYADQLNEQISQEVTRLVPHVREAVIAYYEAYGMKVLMEEMQRDLMNPEVYLRFDSFRDRYNRWSVTHRDYSIQDQCGGIEHPSKSIPGALKAYLTERGFRSSLDGWRDARGVAIPDSKWLELQENTDDSPSHYHWYDPVGMQKIHAKYDAQYRRMVNLGSAASQLYHAASKSGGDDYRSGKLLEECPFAVGTLENVAWVIEWENSLRWRRDLPREVWTAHHNAGVERISFEIEPFRKIDR